MTEAVPRWPRSAKAASVLARADKDCSAVGIDIVSVMVAAPVPEAMRRAMSEGMADHRARPPPHPAAATCWCPSGRDRCRLRSGSRSLARCSSTSGRGRHRAASRRLVDDRHGAIAGIFRDLALHDVDQGRALAAALLARKEASPRGLRSMLMYPSLVFRCPVRTGCADHRRSFDASIADALAELKCRLAIEFMRRADGRGSRAHRRARLYRGRQV